MLLMTSVSPLPVCRPPDPRVLQREARRELLLLLGTATGLLAVAIVLGRSPLGLAGPPGHMTSWTEGAPGLVALRMLRIVLLVGSATFVVWLATLAVMCVPRRAGVSTLLAHLPLGTLVRRALVGTVALALAGSSGGSAMAAARPAVVANDATGGQRWPDLPQQPSPTTPPTGPSVPSTPAPQAYAQPRTPDPAILRTRTILPPLGTPTTTSSLPPDTASPATPITSTVPAGPRLLGMFEPMFEEDRPSIDTDDSQSSADESVSTRTVRAGESFWSIAEDEVLTKIDEATDEDVSAYWKQLIDINRARLPDPNNTDLLWVDTVLTLPSHFGTRERSWGPESQASRRLRESGFVVAETQDLAPGFQPPPRRNRR